MADVLYVYKEPKDWSLLNGDAPSDNLITINGIDYYMGYLDSELKGNKGGNSYI